MKIEDPLLEFPEPKFGTGWQTVLTELIAAHNVHVKRIRELELRIRMLSPTTEKEPD